RDDRGEAGAAPQLPQPVAEILPKRFEPAEAVHVIDLLSNQRGVTELAVGCIARLLRRHAAGNVLVGLGFEIRVQLARPLLIPIPAAEESNPTHLSPQYSVLSRQLSANDAVAQALLPVLCLCTGRSACATAYPPAFSGRSTRLMARTSSSQRLVCRTSCLRPAGVSR